MTSEQIVARATGRENDTENDSRADGLTAERRR
jgi:hypothetical protein